MIQLFYRFLIELTNGKWTSLLLKRFATSRLSRFLIPSFAKIYKINKNEMEQSLNEFPTLHHFFIRRLKNGVRPISGEINSVVSPVDGVLEDFGEISPQLFMRVKGKDYSVLDMLGSVEKAEKYMNGNYIILYLSPSHYHHIHSPFSGNVTAEWTLGSKSYPVNKYGLKYGKEALSKNYRRVTEMEHAKGIAAIVKVGAMFVNSIECIHKGGNLEKGEEMAYFTFGSTVILLFEKNSFAPLKQFQIPMEVKVGQAIGYLRGNELS